MNKGEARREKGEAPDPPHIEGLGLLLDGYFHQDFRTEHGAHEAAARAFAAEASVEELGAARAALGAFISWAEAVETEMWQDALGEAGGAWRPRSLGPLREVLQQLGKS